jgi:hypothetical protein
MVKRTALLSFILGATDTTRDPELAPDGIVTVIDVALQEFTVTAAPFSVTAPLPCVDPNPLPVIVTGLPIAPVVADKPLMAGAALVEVPSDTLSKVAV